MLPHLATGILKEVLTQALGVLVYTTITPDGVGTTPAIVLKRYAHSHTAFCVHGTAAGAEEMAANVQRELATAAPVLAAATGLRLTVQGVGGVEIPDETDDVRVVPVYLGWSY